MHITTASETYLQQPDSYKFNDGELRIVPSPELIFTDNPAITPISFTISFGHLIEKVFDEIFIVDEAKSLATTTI